jgi:CRISPR-associated endonuclease/helicase Cas3
VFELPEIRQRLQADPAPEHLFVVLGSPVTEVGRDHDYDWAIVEPSSMRSIVQLAGRVRRHRGGAVQQPNLLIWQRNLRAQENPGKPAYYRPGFEQENGVFQLHSHDLAQLLDGQLDTAGQAVIDARPRIYRDPAQPLQASRSLVDLEHARLQAQMLPASRQPWPQHPAGGAQCQQPLAAA